MEKIKWCLQIKNGIELIEPNDNLSVVYLKKSENALRAATSLKGNKEWEISSRYYALYFALYSLMMKIGVKCENHNCSIEFMKKFLSDKFNKSDIDLLKRSMKARVDTQYYSDRDVSEEFFQILTKNTPVFIIKCKEVGISIKKQEIELIRNRLEGMKK